MSLDFAGTVDAVLVHVSAAAAAISPTVDDVAFAPPLPRGSSCIRVWYGGEQAPARMGGSLVLDGEMVAERISIDAFFQVGNQDETTARNRMLAVRSLKHQIRTRIQGDSQLGGKTTDLAVEYAGVTFVAIDNALWQVLSMDVITDFDEYPIAP